MNANQKRISTAPWFEEIQNRSLSIVGIGGIGSSLAIQLSRLYPESMNLIDGDDVTEENLAGQMFGECHIGLDKSEAAGRIIFEMSKGVRADSIWSRVIEGSRPNGLLETTFCAVDSMDSRKSVLNSWIDEAEIKGWDESQCIFIDGRLTPDEICIYIVPLSREDLIERYRKEFFKDEEAISLPCTYKQTTYMANLCAALMTNAYVEFIENSLSQEIKKPQTFCIKYNRFTNEIQNII